MRTAKLGCTYDLPTEVQLRYMIRADVTGTNRDRYSKGVNDSNIGQYLDYSSNPDSQIQPVGQKYLNAFGIELGNVRKISKDLSSPAYPHWGQSMLGGSWNDDAYCSDSSVRNCEYAGRRTGTAGFSVIRICDDL